MSRISLVRFGKLHRRFRMHPVLQWLPNMSLHGSICMSTPAWARNRPARLTGGRHVACLGAANGGRPTVSPPPDEVDILVVGSGVGGLSAAALLAKYGAKVAVVEAHNAPGGAAHHWTRGPFSFDSGAALFSGINPLTPDEAQGADLTTANPLSSVLAAIGEKVPDVVDMPDSATCLVYPDGKQYRCQLGSKAFVDVVEERHGSEAARQWRTFQEEVDRLCVTAGAVPPAAVRLDDGVGVTVVFRRPMQFMQYMFGSSGTSSKTFGDIMDEHVTDPNVRDLITMITEGTTSAAPAEIDATYMLRAFHEMWSQNTVLQYPAEGSQAIIDTLVRGLKKHGGTLSLRTRARRVLRAAGSNSKRPDSAAAAASENAANRGSSNGSNKGPLHGIKSMLQTAMGSSDEAGVDTAVAVEVVGPDGCPKVVKVRQAVISNASVWDTERIMTTTGEVSNLEFLPAQQEASQMLQIDERVLQEAEARGAEYESAGTRGVSGVAVASAGSSTTRTASSAATAAAVLDRPNGASRLSAEDSFDSQSMRNPAPGEGVLDSMGSLDADDWSTASCSWEPPIGQDSKWLREDFLDYVNNLEMNASMMHLHVGFQAREGEDLPVHTYFLESEDCGSNGWPTIVIPSVTAPGLAPEGHHVMHATLTEDFEPWQTLARGSREYNARKEERAELLWEYVRKLIPDIDDRVKVTCIGTPLSHARFLRRKCGTYGPANLLNLTGALPKAVQPLENVWCCGDSVFPGVGTPAVAANGMWVANTLVPVQRHMQMLDDLGL